MSRSSPEISRNPAKMYLKWSGKSDMGFFTYFDKTIGDKGEKVKVDFPIKFYLLDELSCITGFSKQLDCGMWSNEVKNTAKSELVVRSMKPGFNKKGLYQALKNEIVGVGGKYTKALYAAVMNNAEMVIIKIMVSGLALQQWSEFCARYKDYRKGAIEITGAADYTNQLGTFKVPLFQIADVDLSEDEIAMKLDVELQEYFKEYFNRKPEDAVSESQEPNTDGTTGDDNLDDLPF